MPNHLLSFLGTGNYLPCRYQHAGETSSVVNYIQLALLELLKDLQRSDTRVSIFLTREAREKHWEPDACSPSSSPRLGYLLKEKFPFINVQAVLIPEGKNTEELWQIFKIVFDHLKEGETLYLDVTHSFRSLPIFGLALLNYSRIVKNVQIGGIFYGAFEVMGPAKEVERIAPENRIAPVFDLGNVYTLMEWSTAVHVFLFTGRAEELAELVRGNLKPILSDPGKINLEAKGEQKLADMLRIVSLDLLTNRGAAIQKGETFLKLQRTFQDLQGKSLNFKPLEPLLYKVQEKIHGFREEDLRNGYRGVQWCIQHGWVQQGITQLQETIITHQLKFLSENPADREKREIVSIVFGAKGSPLGTADRGYQEGLKRNQHLTKTIFDHKFCEVASPPYNQLRDLRNSINHGGFTEQTSAIRFKTNLEESFTLLKNRYKETYGEELF
jgi:CRISPR-associated Csx2 family protein